VWLWCECGAEGKKGQNRFGGKKREEEMLVARQETCDGRVNAHVDMDCFYVQGHITLPFCFNLRSEFSDILLYDVVCVCVVEQRKQPNLRGLPSAIIQYNSYKCNSFHLSP